VVGGGKQFLLKSKIPYIVSEFVPDWMRSRGGDPVQMLNTLYDAGYKVIAGEDIVDQHYLTREEALEMDRYSLNADVIFKLVDTSEEQGIIPTDIYDDPKMEEATTVDISETKTVVAKVDNGGIIDAFDMEVYARNDIVSDAIRQNG